METGDCFGASAGVSCRRQHARPHGAQHQTCGAHGSLFDPHHDNSWEGKSRSSDHHATGPEVTIQATYDSHSMHPTL